MTWSLILSNQASRTIRRAPRDDRDQIRTALRLLTDNPYSGDIKLLKGSNGTLRRRVGVVAPERPDTVRDFHELR
jgi:mRNA-degrading endonuclease RelE of RelBE toxin-antitoxin system